MSDAGVALLSRLLSDRELRTRFRDDRAQVVSELADTDSEAAFLLTINPEQLDAQAETLVGKRQHEVAQLLPATWQKLGNSAPELFRRYAEESPWPESHLRHLQDARDFGAWLTQTGRPPVASEWNRISFVASRGRFALHVVRDEGILPALQLLYRQRSGRVREHVLRLC